MENTEFEHQKSAYDNYVKLFTPELLWTSTIYKDLYNTLHRNLELTKVSMGDYFLEQFLIVLDNNLSKIENEVNDYVQNNNYDNIQKEHIFYHKPLLENRINELFEEYKLKKKSKTKGEETITYYDKILKELKIIEIIFHSQINPDLHLGSGIGLSRYCNKIFIISDIELLKISDYKREYTSRLEQSNNTSLVINELKNIYRQSAELYNFFVTNLLNNPNKKEFFVGEDAEHQIINSTGYYYFINYQVRFCFFEVEQSSEIMSSINSNFFKNSSRYNCKNETLVNFCTQLLDFIKLSEILVENDKTSIKDNKYTQSETEKMYFKIGLLFAQNKIHRKSTNNSYEYYYLEKKIKSVNALSKHLKLTRQYIDDTIKEHKTSHNIYINSKYMKNIVDYCNENKTEIHPDFLKKHNALLANES